MILPLLFSGIIAVVSLSGRAGNLFPQDTIPPRDSMVVFSAGKKYKAGKLKSLFFGKHYRKEWQIPVEAPVFDIRKEGLQVMKQGGSRQTTNLRLTDSREREYVLRSIDKTPERALPEDLRKTFIADILQDQTSTAHPYGAFVIPGLAEPAGVFHTKPRLVFVPEDSAFGNFTKILANQPALFEERPDGPMADLAHFGNPPNVIGTEKMLEKRFKDNDHQIDERLFARTRLLDMLLGDWSRHEDQWRWGVFPLEKGNLYKPIPRDRDHVFFKFDGIFPFMVNRSWALRHLRNFDYRITDLKGLNYSARNIDRIILISLTENDWVQIADSIRNSLTDETIVSAIQRLPPAIFEISGQEIIDKLISRRNGLTETAREYYRLLAKKVTIRGSEKHEQFEVLRKENGDTEVKVYKILKDGTREHLIYHRLFHHEETREIYLAGLGGNDSFNFAGTARKGVKIRVIGGEGIDAVNDSSFVKLGGKKTLLYDTEDSEMACFFREGRDLRSDNPKDSVHNYPNNHQYNYTGPYLYPEYNVDDGLFIGAGIIARTYSFKKYPYATRHRLGINFSTRTGAFNAKYLGDYRQIYRHISLKLESRVMGPKYLVNYFGMGNETEFDSEKNISYYRVKFREVYVSPLLYNEITPRILFGAGPVFQYIRIAETPGRLISSDQTDVDPEVYTGTHFWGARAMLSFISLNNRINPERGIRWNMEATALDQPRSDKGFINLNTDLSIFLTSRRILRFITLAGRVGTATNLGNFYFFHANTLGGTTNLRGYRRTRFYGKSAVYSNTELRIKLVKLQTYLIPFQLGAFVFWDSGRVWVEQDKSDKWHSGAGPGLWLLIYNKFLFSGSYGFSEEGRFVNVEAGFLF